MAKLDNAFIEDVASSLPAPGGGAVCAYVGALASALASMVGNLTIGKKNYGDVEAEVKEAIELLKTCRDSLLELSEEDEQAFNNLVACWKMSKDTILQRRARHEAEQKALLAACEVPLQTMRICAKIIELDEVMAYKGNRTALTDAGSCAVLCKAVLKASALNVYINTSGIEDLTLAENLNKQAADLIQTFGAKADELYDYTVCEVMN